LEEIKQFLQKNPREILTLILESYVTAESVRKVFVQKGLLDWLYAHTAGVPWPTLQEMIERRQRLVVFTDREGGAFPGYHKIWDFAWDTPWSNKKPEDFSCKPHRGAKNRGPDKNSLFSCLARESLEGGRFACVLGLQQNT
jgi:uncharacterized protein (DUF2384 family)